MTDFGPSLHAVDEMAKGGASRHASNTLETIAIDRIGRGRPVRVAPFCTYVPMRQFRLYKPCISKRFRNGRPLELQG